MNRFFSKLDLRDIKIDPEGSRFPPDADERAAPLTDSAIEPQSSGSIENHVDEVPVDLLTDSASAQALSWSDPEPDGVAPIVNGHATPDSVNVQPGGVESLIVGSDGEVLKVSARSRPSAVAGAIAGVVRDAGRAEVQAIGAGATNQAVKAVAIARDYLRETGIDAICVPAFIDVTIENEDRTAIRLVVEPR